MNILIENKNDTCTLGTDQVLLFLERGIIPWRVSWTQSGIPQNLITQKPYRDINIWLLAAHNFSKNFFLTKKQLQKIGGEIGNSESAIPIFSKINKTKKNCPVSLNNYVYNVSQCREIHLQIPHVNLPDTREVCNSILIKMPKMPRILHLENEPYYHPLKDFINLPEIKYFSDKQLYYAALFHELVHCTGHESRLRRKELLGTTPFGSTHTLEELIAEIGTSYLLSYAGIPIQTSESDKWIEGWIDMLYQDDQLIFTASNQAQNAVDYILNNSLFG